MPSIRNTPFGQDCARCGDRCTSLYDLHGWLCDPCAESMDPLDLYSPEEYEEATRWGGPAMSDSTTGQCPCGGTGLLTTLTEDGGNTGPFICPRCYVRAERLAEAEAYAKEGWEWLDHALQALGVETVFDIPKHGRALDATQSREGGRSCPVK